MKKMSTEAIQNRIRVVTSEMDHIRAQLAKAKGNAAATGNYSDCEWFHRASLALKRKGREHQALMLEFGLRRREERKTSAATFERAFIDAARKSLDHYTFHRIMDEAVLLAESMRITPKRT